MVYILIMTMAGSCMTLLYLIFIRAFPHYHFEKIKYLFLKICVLFYLVPLLFLKQFYQTLLGHFPFLQSDLSSVKGGLVYTWRDRATLVIEDGGTYRYNDILRLQILFIGIWVGGAVLCFLWQMFRAWYYRRELMGAAFSDDWEEQGQLRDFCREYHIRRKVMLRSCRQEGLSFTMGVFRPVIFCSEAESPLETELLLRHELIHIRRWDMLWHLLAVIVLGLHWFNPFAWILWDQIKQVRESVCDREVLADRNEEERQIYMRMLILRARKRKLRAMEISFAEKVKKSKQEKKMEERLKNIMKMGRENRPWVKVAAIAVIACATFANSLTALAYPEVQVAKVGENSEYYEEFVKGLLEHDMVFIPDGMENPFYIPPDKVYYDAQFTDEEGNVYPVEEISSYAVCDHTYVSGTYADHNRLSDGGCIYTTYSAQRCSKCGHMEIGSQISTQTSHPCPH